MLMSEPFEIGPRLVPSVVAGDVRLSLLRRSWEFDTSRGIRVERAVLVLDFDGEPSDHEFYINSGYSGFRSIVDIFETALSFLTAAHESYPAGENADLFPAWVIENTNGDDFASVQSRMFDETGAVARYLVKE